MLNNFSIFKEKELPLLIEQNFRAFDQKVELTRLITRRIKILVVTDTAVRIRENDGFGVGRFVKLLRDTQIGCTKFEVDIAIRPTVFSAADIQFEVNPTITEAQPHKYLDFRFDSKVNNKFVLDNYHEVFMFGFAPDNSAGPDSNITNHPWHSTDAELNVLKDWMNQGGGVFATGDHDYLGASMCHRMPRIGTMRKWTNADGVPPIGGPTRLDTNQPVTIGHHNGTQVISISVEGDSVPQAIEWIPKRTIRTGFRIQKLPHEILCHPTLGPIDVMPDHPHEGCCQEPSTINYAANMKFVAEKEYPTFDGFQPKPRIIAYGHVTGRSNHDKGPVNAARFPMISVYDGRENNTSTTGRVVVDSTWHHWFNLNLIGIENDINKDNWNKISRYFINIALWLSPTHLHHHICWWEVIRLQFKYPQIREIHKKTPLLDVGKLVRDSLIRQMGACWTTEFVLENICRVNRNLYDFYKKQLLPDFDFNPIDPICLTCPPFEAVETLVLGQMYRSMEPIADKIKFSMSTRKPKSELKLVIAEIEKAALAGVKLAVKDLKERTLTGAGEIKKIF